MPRSAEVIRQWGILRDIDASRRGVTLAVLAESHKVTQRTIRRDMEALQVAGFALYDEKVGGRTHWKIDSSPFRNLADVGFSLTELAALYFGRTLVECFANTPFEEDLRRAFDKIEAVLTVKTRAFLDRLPAVLAAKPDAPKRRLDRRYRETVARLIEATLGNRRAQMEYHSFSRNRTKEYVIEPYRMVYAQGGLYLFAFVPEYGEPRTFAVERIKKLSLLDERFVRDEEYSSLLYSNSLGINEGEPERIEIEFSPRIARYVLERTWHTSQRSTLQEDGSAILELNVAVDWWLKGWILGWGPFARVLSPPHLAEDVLYELEQARRLYLPKLEFDLPIQAFADTTLQPILPFLAQAVRPRRTT
jgi:predicted DNA-binding transcriptional regulator YafY